MQKRVKRRIGEQLEPGDRPKAPGRLALLQRFLNTWNHESPAEWDRVGTAERTAAWLTRVGLLAGGTRVSAQDAARLRRLREAIRHLIWAGPDPATAPKAVRILERAATRATVRVVVQEDGRTMLTPERAGIDGAVATFLSIMHEAQITGTWERLKGCRRCGYAFYDRSKNRSAAWCAMAICGNRTKNSTYRQRRRTARGL